MEAAKKSDRGHETAVQGDLDTGLAPQSVLDRYGAFRRQLIHRWNELIRHTDAERASIDEQILTSPGDVGDSSVVDISTDYFLKLADNDRRELIEIREAFIRMQRGTYGTCEACELEIPIERLEKLPQARRCVDCQTLTESKSRAARMNVAPKL